MTYSPSQEESAFDLSQSPTLSLTPEEDSCLKQMDKVKCYRFCGCCMSNWNVVGLLYSRLDYYANVVNGPKLCM